MNREILFRGKRIDNEEWVEGKPLANNVIVPVNQEFKVKVGCIYGYEIIPETVGQYTGLCDRNGTKIFEGDIVEHTTFYNENIRTGYVEYSDRYAAFFIKGSGHSDNQMYAFCNFKVIGNIHDNSELLEEENE